MPTHGMASVTSMKRSCGLQPQRDAQHHRVGVHAVDDDAAPAAGILERRAHRAGLAAGERRHGVEQVREAGEAVAQRGCGSRRRWRWCGRRRRRRRPATSRSMISGVVISGASVTSVRPPRSEVSKPERARVELAQLGRIVDALARDVEERAPRCGCRARPARRPRSRRAPRRWPARRRPDRR